jgi:hypothetical protein
MDHGRPEAASGRNKIFHHEGHEEHEEERGKEAFRNHNSTLQSRKDESELESRLSLRLCVKYIRKKSYQG